MLDLKLTFGGVFYLKSNRVRY